MNRRHFIKGGALFVPATFGILTPSLVASTYLPHRRKAFASSADITTGLVAHYPLNEASGNALDASGNSRTMTQTGTVGAGSGGTANSRGTYAAGNYFGRTDAAFQLNSGDYSITGWFYLNSTATEQEMIGQQFAAANGSAFSCFARWTTGSTSKAAFRVCDNGLGGGTVVEAPGSAASTGAWHFMACTFKLTTLAITCQLDGGTVGTGTFSGTLGTPTTTPTTIGAIVYAGYNFPLDGFAGKVRVFSRVLAAADIAALYNGGTFSTAP